MKGSLTLLFSLLTAPLCGAVEQEYELLLQYRGFTHSGQFEGQDQNQFLAGFDAKWIVPLTDNQELVINPVGRVDSMDDNRSQLDFSALYWIYFAENWQLKAGIDTVFWGVAESNHLVNIINQIDTTYDFDMETRFGQPMVSASYLFDASSLTVMYLPFFRPRNYPSPDGRIRTSLPVVDDEIYLAGASETSNDIAVRWSTIIDNLDLNLFGFHGINRAPSLVPNADFTALVPQYSKANQFGFDAQLTLENTLLKAEYLYTNGLSQDFSAAVAGLEYTLVSGFDSPEVSAVLEYNWDERGKDADTALNRDLFLATRVGFNNASSSELLAGVYLDTSNSGQIWRAEYSQRVGEQSTLEVVGWIFNPDSADIQLQDLAREDGLSLTFHYYF
ncbi:hypothetical protein [Enterovibrio paralichthyis]|uniref:hypothetical protein n=1 Tax=Enterovibrio paralichthyis TaxID=2853805 RepID=UPI001C478CBB|nr:hypothetical protein [Enterovibrio paralichthyis]MBV7298354.1 hypothetical protein [Enterovibrio paralichthyis]